MMTWCDIEKILLHLHVNMIEYWTFIPVFLFFNRLISGFQDASAWVTEGLVLRI